MRVLRSSRGLPQGLNTSDTLATCYLTHVDRTVVSYGFRYVRHGDDIRMSVLDYLKAARSTFCVGEIAPLSWTSFKCREVENYEVGHVQE